MTISIHALIDRMDNAQLDRLERHLKITKPRYVRITAGARFDVAMQFIERLATSCPATRPMLRQWPDDGLWKLKNVEAFYNERIIPRKAWLSRFHVIWIPDNESLEADLTGYAAWMDNAIMHCQADGIELGVGTFSTGNPQASQYPQLDRMFQALEDFGGVYTPHEYFGRTPQASSGHLNRYTEAWAYCDSKGIQRPPTVIGEYGLCGVIDGHLDPHAGFRKLGVLSADYARNFTIPNYEAWYKANGVTVCTFCAGDWDGHGFDVDEGYYQVIEAYAAKDTTPMPLPSMPKPSNANDKHRMKATQEVELLAGPAAGYALKGVIHEGFEVDLYNTPSLSDRGMYFKWADVRTGPLVGMGGWVRDDVNWQEVKKATTEVPPIVIVPPPPPPPPPVVVVDPPPLEPVKRYQIVIELPPELAAFAQYFDQIKWKVVEV